MTSRKSPPPGSVTKEAIAQALRDLRQHAQLTQADLVRRTQWARSVVSRLESPSGPLPDLTTIALYARACDLEAGLLFATPTSQGLHVRSALTLQSALHHRPYELLHDELISCSDEEGQGT
jgi:transcriptional regulator with XRE-family HTH domain